MNATAILATVPRHVGRVAILTVISAGLALAAVAQSAKEVKGATPLVAIANEAPPKLIVDPPIPEQLALGRVFIQYRTENLRILPVFGSAGLAVSPRVGHLHYYVDGQSWPIVDTSGETVVLTTSIPYERCSVSPDSTGSPASSHPWIPADITWTLANPICFALRAAFGAFLHRKLEQ